MTLACITPHGKWHIHSTYDDDLRMLTLSRGVEPFWLNDQDAAEIGVQDNDWVEAYNDNGVVVTRAVVSARIPRGLCILLSCPGTHHRLSQVSHAQEPARRWDQQHDPDAAEAGPDGRRLCAATAIALTITAPRPRTAIPM